MKKYPLLLSAVILLFAAIACSRIGSEPNPIDNALLRATYAPIEDESSIKTRTQLDANGRTYYWSTGDEIAVFSSTDWSKTMPGGNRFRLIDGSGQSSATFQMDGTPSGTCRYSVYPFRFINPDEKGTKSGWMYITLPTEQDGSIANAVSVAKDDKETGTWSFSNVSSVVKMTVDGNDHIRSINILFEHPVTGKMIAAGGGVKLTANGTNAPDNNNVRVISESDLDGDVYFSIFPIEAGSIAITFTNSSGMVSTVRGHTGSAFTAGRIKNLGSFSGMSFSPPQKPDVLTSYSWPVSVGQAKVSEHFRVYVSVDGGEEKELTVLQSDPIVNSINVSGKMGEDNHANYTRQRSFSFVPVSFDDSSGAELTFRVESLDHYNGSSAVIAPASYGIPASGSGNSASFTVSSSNRYLVVDFNTAANRVTIPEGTGSAAEEYKWIKNMLCIWVDPPETRLPDPSAQKVVYYSSSLTAVQIENADVLYFRPGYYNLQTDGARGDVINSFGGLRLKDQQQIYIAGGAYVEGYIRRNSNSDSNQMFYGRGILSGRQYTWQPGNPDRLMGQLIQAGSSSVFDGLIVMESPHHGIVPKGNSMFRNIKFLGWHCNNDGFRPGNNSEIANCFIRACDDFFYNYALNIHDCVLWPAFNGSIMTNGWQDIDIGGSTVQDIDIVFPEWLSMGNNKGLIMSQNEYAFNPPVNSPETVFRDIRFEGTIPGFVNLKPASGYDTYSSVTGTNESNPQKVPLGSLSELGWMGNMLLENVTVTRQAGDKARGMSSNLIRGARTVGKTTDPVVKNHPEAVWQVRDITFRNVTIGGVKVTALNKGTWFVIDNDTTENIVFE